MTIAEAIRAAAQRLAATSDTARLDAELLMAYTLDVSRSDMLLRLGRGDWAVPEDFGLLVDRRATHEPIAYILGEQEFYGRSFQVTPDVLIPRGDSETLIEAALELAPGAKRILDLGTGSGALLLTTLSELANATGVAMDVSEAALAVAESNAERLGLGPKQAEFAHRDWGVQGWSDGLGTFDLILCNPPYVETSADLDENVSAFEPADALFAGEDGLDDYRILMPQMRALLNQGGVAVFEIGAAQADPVTKIAQSCGFSVETRRDLANRPRLVVLS